MSHNLPFSTLFYSRKNYMCVTPQDDDWAAYNFVCESCGKEFQITTNKDW